MASSIETLEEAAISLTPDGNSDYFQVKIECKDQSKMNFTSKNLFVFEWTLSEFLKA